MSEEKLLSGVEGSSGIINKAQLVGSKISRNELNVRGSENGEKRKIKIREKLQYKNEIELEKAYLDCPFWATE